MAPPDVKLPTGTVTFLFSDIEGSTRLVQAVGPGPYGRILEQHQALLRDVFGSHGGIDRGTEGDSFFVVFRDAHEAVEAAVDGQRSLAGATWPEGVELRVRMGLHTGIGMSGGDDYVGVDVNRAARIAAAAHGGQVLVSDATRALTEPSLPSGIGVRDLGWHRLKDLDRPERLFQLVADGLRSNFPPPRVVAASGVGNLPPRLTSFLGRDDERRLLARLLAETRLVTVTGPGGTGKTSVALAVARDVAATYPDGAWFVPLESVADPELVPAAIIRALRLDLQDARPAIDRLTDYLRDRVALLVLDNFEHLPRAAATVRRLMADAAGTRFLVASQAPLHLSGEQEFPLAPLPVPPPSAAAGSALDSPSVRLFVDRARAVRPEFALDESTTEMVIAICERLQGLPLAIELAAAQIRLLSPSAILDRLSSRIETLGLGQMDLPERQRTLHAAVSWSYELLRGDARALLRRLSVFSGPIDFDAIERATAAVPEIPDPYDALSTLIDRSLVRPVGGDRFGMLETIRTFAADRLREAGERDDAIRRHATTFMELAERAESKLYRSDRRIWFDRLAADHDNIRAALDRMEQVGELDVALRTVAAIWRFWQQSGNLAEAGPRVERLLRLADVASSPLSPALMSRAEEAAGGIAYWLRTASRSERAGGATDVEDHYRRSLALARAAHDPAREAQAIYNLSFAYDFVPASGLETTFDRAAAVQLRQDALRRFRELGDTRGVAYALWGLGSPLVPDDPPETKLALLREAAERFREADDAFGETWALLSTGMVEASVGNLDEALPSIQAAGSLFARDGDGSGQLVVFDAIAALLALAGEHELAVRVDAAGNAFRHATGASTPPIPIFRRPLVVARQAVGDACAAQEQLGAQLTFEALLDASTRSRDRGLNELAHEIRALTASPATVDGQ
ncbi:MAG TPA: adenylate/guanylate cyclase domain-containing protein [Candidatus Limnocylindrales bacterium]|nr:adenylate/guanylate cyclase domain-containing protein [Candidatus Limnocylindrales bacterium]